MNIGSIIKEELQNIFEGIHVFHGSDRQFDKFDMNKIGTGDGKSLGGWGIYFSNSEDVSNRYYTSNGFVRDHEIRNGPYFDLDEQLSDGYTILKGLQRMGVDENNLEEFQNDMIQGAENYGDVTNRQVYEWLSYVLGGEMQASKFLESIGYIGNTMIDRWNKDARNYIVFDTKYIIR